MSPPKPEAGLLRIAGLDAYYGRAQVLFSIDLSLGAGEVLALVGRNGAGKSTLLKAVMGLVRTEARKLVFDGTDIARRPTHAIARLGLGYVPEDRRIFTNLTVEENLVAGTRAGPGGQEDWTPERIFALFPNLADMRSRSASQMSGGEQQMLAVARTLMGNPTALLLDEPSEGLAPVIVDAMAEALNELRRQGLSIVLSEQNLRFAGLICDRAAVLATGAITYDGPLAMLADDPALLEARLGL